VLLETVELTMSHVGLGTLTECALLHLFSNAHAHHLTIGTENTIRDIKSADGDTLYPSSSWTHLTVPTARLLRDHDVWNTVSVGVDIRTFAGMLLNSTYVLGRDGEIPEDPAAWDSCGLPFMRAGNMFTIDGEEGEPRPAVPRPDTVAKLPQASKPPQTVGRFRSVKDCGTIDPSFDGRLASPQPLEYAIVSGRDISPQHGVTWCAFIQLAENIERQYMTRHVWPAIPAALLDCLALVERETCYLASIREEGLIQANVRAKIEPCPEHLRQVAKGLASVGALTTAIELYHQRTGALCLATKAVKLFAVPVAQQSIINDMNRILACHGQRNG